MAHRTAAERREARHRKRNRPSGQGGHRREALTANGWEITALDAGPQPGPDVGVATLDEVMGAVGRLPGDLPWEEVAPRVLPQFERARPYRLGLPERVATMVPPGLPVSLSIDMGPAIVHVSASMLDGWSMSVADVTARALANLHDRAAKVRPADVLWDAIDGVRTGWLQTKLGIGATLVLAPQELVRILGPGPRLLVAPMRDLLITLPPDEADLAMWLYAEIASQDPNHLRPRLLDFDGQRLSVRAIGA